MLTAVDSNGRISIVAAETPFYPKATGRHDLLITNKLEAPSTGYEAKQSSTQSRKTGG